MSSPQPSTKNQHGSQQSITQSCSDELSQTPSQAQSKCKGFGCLFTIDQDSMRRLSSRHWQNLETLNSLEQTVAKSSCVTHRGKQLWGCR